MPSGSVFLQKLSISMLKAFLSKNLTRSLKKTTVSSRFLAQFKRGMRLLQFVEVKGGRHSVGVEAEANGSVIDLCKYDSSVPNCMRKFLEDGERCFDIAKKYVSLNPQNPC